MTMTRMMRITALLTVGLAAGCGSSNNNVTTKDAGSDTGSSDTGSDSLATDGGDSGSGTAKITPPEQPTLAGGDITKFVDDLPTYSGNRVDGKSPVTVDMVEFQEKVLPASFYTNLPAPYNAGTYLWGYKVNGGTPSFPSQTIEATQGMATTVTYTNSLQGANNTPLFLQRALVTDLSVHNADPAGLTQSNKCLSLPPLPAGCLSIYAPPVPAVVHLHGAEVLSDFDGMPDTWFTPNMAAKGPAYVSNVFTYPNKQEATTLWFHDHALGLTRQHVYAGLAGFYLIRDANDTGTATNPMKLPAGAYEQEMMVADRQFDVNGQLYFPAGLAGSGSGFNGGPPNPDHHPYWIPEFFGDVMTVNGKSWPVMHVEPRRYRFRFVNASNARFLQMQLFVADTTQTPAAPTTNAGPSFWQIGTDGGFLNAPVNVDLNPIPGVFIAPAERADVIVDFTGKTGSFILTNGQGCDDMTFPCGAFAPFPSGDPPDPGTNGQVMMFTVDKTLTGTDTSFDPSPTSATIRNTTAGHPAPMVDIRALTPNVKRQLVLVEVEGAGGPLEVMLNNSHWDGNRENLAAGATATPIAGSVPNGHGIAATENPQVGATEIWEVANLTEDAHPIHIHLIQFQLIEREDMVLGADGETIYRGDWDAAFPGGTFNGEMFDQGTFIPGYGPPKAYNTANADGALGGNIAFSGTTYLMGSPTAAAGSEVGWKDTIKMLPKTVTRIAIRYAPQDTPATGTGAAAPGMNLFSFDPTAAGPGYVWHCHILDHEDNEMMRPYLLKK
jgi:FtsP/CotA-like multicopper oxidase with cupredoxin domain